ncbi:MAG TPA: YbjN domain-containing protein [Candidatus Limnocylindrales bacterium]|nr:YbjN domain-containing protein [Candidatus Limnocylindrales bacterium]
MSLATTATAGVRPADVEGWLRDLDLRPLERVERDGVVAWDLDLDGRRRFGLRVTLILDPALGLVCWAHYAPPIGDGYRRSYRKLLRWNDELPFVKFSLAEDDRPILSVELPRAGLDADELGLALARLLGVSDRLLDESAGWLWLGGKRPTGYGQGRSRNEPLLQRYEARLPELFQQ